MEDETGPWGFIRSKWSECSKHAGGVKRGVDRRIMRLFGATCSFSRRQVWDLPCVLFGCRRIRNIIKKTLPKDLTYKGVHERFADSLNVLRAAN
jgi:hypothetical protein